MLNAQVTLNSYVIPLETRETFSFFLVEIMPTYGFLLFVMHCGRWTRQIPSLGDSNVLVILSLILSWSDDVNVERWKR